MKKIFAILLICSIVIACKNKQVGNTALKNDDVKEINEATAATVDVAVPDRTIEQPAKPEADNKVEANYTDSIDFEKYHVEVRKTHSIAPIDWASYPDAKVFKTRITEAYKTTEITFAGHYVLSAFGCGASCIMGFMVDVRDGKIYDLPLGEENSCLYAEDRMLCGRTSRLFIAGVCKENPEDKQVYYKAYLWDEDKKEFNSINSDEFLIKN